MLYVFGKILKCNGEHFIFLSDGEECYYLAKILSREITDLLEQQAAKLCGTDKSKRSLNFTAFDYVILTKTREFKDRAAHYNSGSKTSLENYDETNIDVDSEDLKELKKEILDSSGVPTELKERLQKIGI